MGAVYNVYLSLRFKSDDDIIGVTHAFIESQRYRAVFDGDNFSDLIGAIQCIFTERGLTVTSVSSNEFIGSASFDASYGWEPVMCNWFESIAYILYNGSSIELHSDENQYYGIVQNGIVLWGESMESITDLIKT